MAVGIKSEEAIAWATKVQAEFVEVSEVLKRVNDVCNSSPEEEDEGMKIIFTIGEGLEEGWNELNGLFGEFISTCGSIVSAGGDAVESVAEAFGKLTRFFK